MASEKLPEYVTQMYSTTQDNSDKSQKDYINKMYDASLESQKADLQTDYEQAGEQLTQQQEAAQRQTDANLTRTYVEAEKARKNYQEVQNAYGLTSGAMAQARLSQDNQLQADLTALRAQQQEADASIERERGLLAKEYAAAIRQAQANNDIARAEALYAAAQREEERLLQQQEAAAQLMAGQGDYARLAALYGLTEAELRKLTLSTTYNPVDDEGGLFGSTKENGTSGLTAALGALTQAGKEDVQNRVINGLESQYGT